MILRYRDWAKYPNAIVDMQTSNKSFIELAGLYKLMGIKNHQFILALHNPQLVGVDPHDPNITRKQRKMILKEAYENPWYFYRECVKAPPLAGIEPNPFKANRGNIATLWLFFSHIMTLLIQPRQTGKSFTVDSLMSGLLNLWCTNTKMNLLTKDEKLRVETVARVKDVIEYLPPYMIMRTSKDSNNGEGISIGLNNNVYKTHVAQSSVKGALNAARGLSSPIMHIDEFAYYSNIGTTLPAALPATGAAMDDARQKGEPHGVLLTTTAGWLDSKSGAYAYDFYNEAVVWDEHFYDIPSLKEFRKVLRYNGTSESEIVVVDMNHRQLGFTDQELKRKIQDSRSTGGKAETDFLNIWADGSATSPFDKAMLKRMKDSVYDDVPYTEISEYGYVLRWMVTDPTPILHESIIMGIDTSDALGENGDDIAVVIRKVSNGEVLAAGQYNGTNIITFAEWLVSLLQKYDRMTIIIERRSSGMAIIDHIMKMLSALNINPYTRLFSWIVQNAKANEEACLQMLKYGTDESFQDKHRREVGYATSNSGRASRDKLYGESLVQSMEKTHTKVFDKPLMNQINQLKIRNSRIDHKSGSHDDLVIAWLLGYWFLNNAKNVKIYGMQQEVLLSEANFNRYDNDKDIELVNKIKSIDDNISTLMNRLKNTEDDYISKLLIKEITKLKHSLPPEHETHTNIESTIKEMMLIKDRKQNDYNFDDIAFI